MNIINKCNATKNIRNIFFKREKGNKGITLLSLVVTIIILIILAGIAINTLIGENGIITKSIEAKRETEVASEEEQLQLIYMSVTADKNIENISVQNLKDEIENSKLDAISEPYENLLKVTFNQTGNTYTLSTSGKIGKQENIFENQYKKAKSKLETLSLDEKIAQLFIIGTSSKTNYTNLNNYKFGGHLYLLDSFKDTSGNILGVNTIKEQIKTSQEEADIPLIMSIDEEGETVSRINKTLATELGIDKFKNSSDLYASGGLDAIRTDTQNKSKILRDLGFNVNFAPDVDIADAGFYIYNRTLKQDAATTAQFARTVIEASKGTGVSYTLKHFPGYGNSTDTHSGFSTDNRELSEFENKDLLPFKAGIEANAEVVMVSHNIITCIDGEEPASISKPIHDYLRDNLNYTGIIITDAINMDAIAKKYSTKDSIIKAINAGNDLICIVIDEGQKDQVGGATLTYSGIIQYVHDAIDAGQISEDTINTAVQRILAWKYYKGLM